MHSLDAPLYTLKGVFSDLLKYMNWAGVMHGQGYQVELVVCALFVVRLHVVQSVMADALHRFLVLALRTVLETFE